MSGEGGFVGYSEAPSEELKTVEYWSGLYTDCLEVGREMLAKERATIEQLRAALVSIAQYDPRWTGTHVNDAPNRQQLIERAFDALLSGQHTGRGQGGDHA